MCANNIRLTDIGYFSFLQHNGKITQGEITKNYNKHFDFFLCE